jgi:hypothetical protein
LYYGENSKMNFKTMPHEIVGTNGWNWVKLEKLNWWKVHYI